LFIKSEFYAIFIYLYITKHLKKIKIIKKYIYKIEKGGDKMLKNSLGGWAFLVGVLLAIVLAFFGQFSSWAWLLVVLGLIVGFLNITEAETQKFLFAGTILVIVGNFAGDTLNAIQFLPDIFDNLVALFAPATVVVALKSAFEMAKK
jgi:O-antigen ligase|tara:strand:- start:6901 stop:7341 length:441 start_codon:yes stop_codon:yes gene_type:complete